VDKKGGDGDVKIGASGIRNVVVERQIMAYLLVRLTACLDVYIRFAFMSKRKCKKEERS
jgi:hypothetical protein